MTEIITLWSHALAALLYGALAVWHLRYWKVEDRNGSLAIAFAVTACWCIFVAFLGPRHLLSGLGEATRNFAFLAFMYGIVRGAGDPERQPALRAVYFTVAGVIGLQVVIAGVLPRFETNQIIYAAISSTANVLSFTVSAGSLVLVHNLYGQAAPDSRWGIRLPAIGLAGMWAYDLHLYTVAYLTRDPVVDLFALRGAILAALVPVFAIAIRRTVGWKMKISRAATFQSVSVLAILVYLVIMMSATQALEIIGGDWIRIGQVGVVFGMTLIAAIFLPSGKARAWLRVMLAKHLFEHRYDYREEWLRFTRTIGLGGQDDAPLNERVIKALADIAASPSGLLLIADDQHRLQPTAGWNWHGDISATSVQDANFVKFIEASAHVIDFEGEQNGIKAGEARIEIPAALKSCKLAWAGIPLLHLDRLVGLVILEHPLVKRPLDWEDFDLFRTAGIQAASYLAEAQSQEALANSRRFDEFNRRFAFIMHDIKNLVSQLSLVARNAERHAENPEFRTDMIATLQASVKKMNDLLARLSHGKATSAEPPRTIPVLSVVKAVCEAKRRHHPIIVEGDESLAVIADPVRLEQALEHLVQNGIDASSADEPVRIDFGLHDDGVVIKISDKGTGMSAEFIRSRLFQPFSSTKNGGFGIGAFEARTLITSMGGRILVESREGEGSCFIVILPSASGTATGQVERMRA